MKVFISHSTQDKWIARRLSQDLEALGVTTFLDEKDISTGESIDDSIQQHLADSDEILMLLSPAALKSHWVLMEIGGAKALGKRLIPILLHVGPNDLPQPLSKGLARDLNDVDKYLEELAARKTGAPTPEPRRPTTRRRKSAEAVAASRRRRTFKLGDLVKIPEQPQEPWITPAGTSVSWTSEMTPHAGKSGTVTEVDTDRTVLLDVDGGEFWWAMDWLEPAPADG